MRIGIASAHIRDHSVWNAIVKGWLQNLDRNRFDVRLFHLGKANDVETALAKTLSTHYTYGKTDPVEWAQIILGHQLDVLIYPEIGMDPVTAKLASLRLAPVQAASWGHPITTGLPTIDYFLSADALEPPQADDHYTERLVRLPGLGCFYDPPKGEVPEIDPAALGIREGVPLLVCAGTPFKYTPRHDAVLVEIARRLGECQLVFFTPPAAEVMERLRFRLEGAFARAGLDLARFAVFVPWQNRQAFRGLLQQADVYLDTLGFSGFNTVLQAIECGLPVAAWEGRFLRGRLASGVLRRMGMDELVAGDEAAYVETIVRLAQDAAYWGGVRERMNAARGAPASRSGARARAGEILRGSGQEVASSPLPAGARSGSPQYCRISARTRSRRRTAAAQSVPSGAMGAHTVTATGARRAYQVPSRSTERTPRSATGTTGTPAWPATWNAPARNAISPVLRVRVPSGNTTSEAPPRTASTSTSACSALFCTSKRSTKIVAKPLSSRRISGFSSNSRLATNEYTRGPSSATSTTASR